MTQSHHDFDGTPAFWYRVHDAGKPFAPACERNKGSILVVLRRVFADAGDVIEIGSGTLERIAADGSMTLEEDVAMPSSNRTLVWRKAPG